MKKRSKQILTLILIFALWGLLHLVFHKKEAPVEKGVNTKIEKVFVMDESRHLSPEMFHNMIKHKNTRILNLSGQKNHFLKQERVLTQNIETIESELNTLEKTHIYLAYCSNSSCPEALFEAFYKKGLALYDLKGGI